jgi:hypothetical protein
MALQCATVFMYGTRGTTNPKSQLLLPCPDPVAHLLAAWLRLQIGRINAAAHGYLRPCVRAGFHLCTFLSMRVTNSGSKTDLVCIHCECLFRFVTHSCVALCRLLGCSDCGLWPRSVPVQTRPLCDRARKPHVHEQLQLELLRAIRSLYLSQCIVLTCTSDLICLGLMFTNMKR